jgi:hypothetical protein
LVVNVTMQLHVTEHKSTGPRNPVPGRTVRVFVNRDYHYGYWVDEAALFALLTAEQQQAYLATDGEIKLDVPEDIAQQAIDIGDTPYNKVRVA